MMNKRLIIDAQVFQTPAWHRGMGKYSLELIRSIVRENTTEERWSSIDVIISGNLDVDQGLEAELKSLDKISIQRLDLVANDILNPKSSSSTNRQALDAYVDTLPDGDKHFLILSLMQGEISPVFPTTKVYRSVLFYDLIPLMMHKVYLGNPITRKEYLSKLSELLAADVYLAISKTVANDLGVYLGIPPQRIVNIDGGPIVHDEKTEPYHIEDPYILMPTGNDLRKNNRRGIEAFNIFNAKHDNKYKLVITSYFKDEEKTELLQLSDNVIFSGNISGAQLNFLYKNTEAVLFPSEYEGLGLPVLEALENKKCVACSDISVFREISKNAFCMFNPTRIDEIAKALEDVVSRSFDQKMAHAILSKYSWINTASTSISALLNAEHTGRNIKKQLTVVIPDVTTERRTGKFILQLHSMLSEYYDLHYYQSSWGDGKDECRINFLPYIAEVSQLSEEVGCEITSSDLNLYHISSDNSLNRGMIDILAQPGVIVLHDTDLSRLWKGLLESGLISQSRYDIESEINKRYLDNTEFKWVGSLIAQQKKIIVFSKSVYTSLCAVLVSMGIRDDKVLYVQPPSNELVYLEVSPTVHDQKVDKKALFSMTDMQYEEAISRTSSMTLSAMSSDELLLGAELAKYKKVPKQNYMTLTDQLIKFIEKDL
ncbi:glycosyltransferase family 4 protein [Candidatus Saccharibacteria bacterium]|nr:glycosyltransferase family 4 protein [Candidatus Saccharibacteria bacterium]MBH1973240.1 glycosyltransferase family 4 protein [Candidatus Saccharibacteria bacterium]MBH1990519.1 glycosyltransferase family 4 protein [Candidatus Saccharibacteria bacterium]